MKLMSDSLAKIAPAIVKAQAEMGVAIKDTTNPFFKKSYADLNAVREAVMPAFNKNGISITQPSVVFEGRKYIQTILLHESGEYFSGLTEILSVKEADPQAQGSGISYARRYGLQSLTNAGAEDDDANSASGRKTAEPVRGTAGEKFSQAAQERAGEVLLKLADVAATQKLEQNTPPATGSKSFRKPKAPANEEL